jgi:hypothetical protein
MYMLNYLELFKFHYSISFDEPTKCIYISKIKYLLIDIYDKMTRVKWKNKILKFFLTYYKNTI